MTLTVKDLFCGGGGSSLGAVATGRVELVMAANHWPTAIEVHEPHFPEARHDCADISQVDPGRYPTTDILLASPECTNHSQSRGVSRKRQDPSLWDAPDPAAERSRATMWDVPRFAEHHRYQAVVVENVVEAARWVGWRGWLTVMTDLGFSHQVLSINSQDHRVPQSRDRIYVVFWRGKTPDLEFEVDGWCASCEQWRPSRQAWKPGRTVGRWRQQWIWACTTCGWETHPARRGAAEIIDWSLPCPRIGDRARPLAEKTRARILAGLRRHGWVPVTTAGAGNTFETTPGNRSRPLGEPVATQSTTATTALVTPPEAALLQTAHGGRFHSIERPHPTVCASDDRLSLLMRNNTGGGEMVTTTDEPVRTLTTTGHQSLLVPYYGQPSSRPVSQPVGTVVTRDRWALIDPDAAVDDCGFRMLEPFEAAAAMAFPEHYIPRDLTKRDQMALAGNAVTPPVMSWIVDRLCDALEASR